MFRKLIEKLLGNNTTNHKLEFPITLRFPLPDEVPMDETVLADIKRSETANIVEGYTIKDKDVNPEHSTMGFEFYSEINIDNSRLWKLFIELTNFLPNEVTLLSGHIDDDSINTGTYADKKDILHLLNKYEKELTGDTFLEFGLLSHTPEKLIEVFVDETKYIKFWGSDKKLFEQTLKDFGLSNIEDLEFIDEFPKVRLPLTAFDETVMDTDQLLELLKTE